MSAANVLKFIKEKEAEFVDLRFTTLEVSFSI
jgi:hypothetical protein